ncbi:hypothetical protein An16g02720 [Aspergillus niger]|uniref:Uncharacterized protein n=2 Tax=Aspergillus niger TaxID=5061 RepID=A2R793_ASPNC|nr:hypothetical protein An16g02720 [Aspergillus niger]CAK46802.1 hypothetical protein An16g02720 [Aspergillus niger]
MRVLELEDKADRDAELDQAAADAQNSPLRFGPRGCGSKIKRLKSVCKADGITTKHVTSDKVGEKSRFAHDGNRSKNRPSQAFALTFTPTRYTEYHYRSHRLSRSPTAGHDPACSALRRSSYRQYRIDRTEDTTAAKEESTVPHNASNCIILPATFEKWPRGRGVEKPAASCAVSLYSLYRVGYFYRVSATHRVYYYLGDSDSDS